MIVGRREVEILAEILADVARAEIVPRFRNLAEGSVRQKSGPLDFVTEADEIAERAITARLETAFPGAVVVGEEAAAADPAVLQRLDDAAFAIVVDPIDGTANFAAGLPLFGTMAAIVAAGEVVASAIHDPLGQDTALALRGEGAAIVFPDGRTQPLKVAAPAPFEAMAGKAAPRHFGAVRAKTLSQRLLGALATWDYRCAAHEYRMVAGGHCHFSLYNTLMPWDHLPGVLLHAEAGGHAAKLDGSPYRPTDRRGGLLCAPDRESWATLREALFD